MKRLSTFLAALFFTATAIFADLPFRNHRYDSFKVLNVTSDNIVFIGNSITDMHCWPEAFVTSEGEYLPIVNRGNSGTYSTEQSDNLESYINGKPKKVFMMIGTNDIATSGGLNFSPEQVLAYVKSIVTRIHVRSPQTKVYLYSILKNKTGNRVEATWIKANELIKAYAESTDKVTYIDLYDKLTGVADGGAWSYDNLHLTAGAYQAWCETICQYLQEGEDYTVSCVYPANTLTVQNAGGLGGSHGMRGTYFSCLPISTNDVLVFGDSFIKNGEWQEFLGNRNVKNRGTGWGNSGDIATTSKIVDATYAAVSGVTKQNAKAIFLYTGTGDCTGSTDMATVKANYQTLVEKIAGKSPTSKIYLMAICPRNNASHNARIAELNTYMESLKSDNIRYIDTYTPFLNDNVANSAFITGDYLYGLGYAKMANLMKEALAADFPGDTYNVTTEEDAATRYAQAGLRNQLTQVIARGLVATRGNEAGQYNAAKMAAFDAKLTEASTLLEKSSITQDEVTAMANSLNEILNEALSMPKASTANEEFWYQLNTPNRLNKYLSSTGAGAGVVGADKNNYATSMWKFVTRQDGSFDIINRHDNSYLAPTAAYNAQLSTSATQPAAGWTLSYCNAPGLYIVSSGTVQLNQTDKSGTPVYNWSAGQSGTDRGDTGCQYMVTLVENEPDELPDPSELTLTLGLDQFESGSGKATWTKNVSSSDGWYGKFVTSTTPAVTVESTTTTVNNMGWSQKRPWLQTGYSYNISLPEGFVITEYELTTLEGGGFSGTYTYTTAEGTATSPAQTGTAQTVTANGLSTRTITLKVGEGTDGTKGIMMTKLVINYREVLPTLTYTIDKASGNLYNGANANQNWNSTWKSTAEPQLVFSCGANNMNWYNDANVQLMTGTATTATYTLTAPEGYVIGNYSFTFANNGHDTGLGLAMTGGNTYTTTRAAQTTSARNQELSTMSFVLSGNNGNGVVLTNFTVTLVDPAIAGTEDVEDEDALNAAKTTAKAAVTANAANLKANVGYYSYTVAGAKVYNAEAVTAAIDAAATIDAVETIVATYALNVPEVGKYYRIKGKSSGKYIDAAGLNNAQMNMNAEANRDFLGSIFLLDEGSKWLNMATNTYVKDTHSIGADKNGANTWTFVAGNIGYIKLKSNANSPWLHDNTGNSKTDRCSSDGADHEFSLEEVHAYTITVNGPIAANATATWNGETKKLPATWSLFEGMAVADATLTINCASHSLTSFKEGETTIADNSIEISDLNANRTFTTTFAPNIFSATYGEKWIHITRASNVNHAISLGNAAVGTIPTFNNINYADEGTLWCFVGTAENFKIYNRTSGNALALTPSETPANGVTIELAEDTEATNWHLISYNDGYGIVPVGNTSFGINSFGGADFLGGPIKFWGVGDGGSHWRFNMIDTTMPLTLSVKVSGEQPYHVNYRVAELTTTIAEQTSKSIVMGDVEAMTYYLPVGATITLDNTFTYRGYTFDGFKDTEGNATEYTNATIPAGGINVTVSYSVDKDNKYQYLFYSNDPVMNKPYRIPAIAVTRKGTILAVTDHRPGGSDVGFAPVDIKIRRSNDNGKTWTDEEFIADGTGQHVTVDGVTHTNVFSYAFGDAALVADRESDEVLIMCVGGKQNFPGGDATHHNYTARLRSHDGGITWDEPENVTANFMDVAPLFNNENPYNYTPILPEAYTLFYGSGRILQSRVFKAEGSKYYRIYAALLVREVVPGASGASHNNYVVYSDNFGETWNLLGSRCILGGDEAKVEELPDGTIIISSRKAYGRYFNIFTFTDIATGEGSWSNQVASENIEGGIKYGSNACNGEFYKVKAVRNSDDAICDVMLQSVPTGQRGDYTADGRNDVTIFYKEMSYTTDYTPTTFAENWSTGIVVSRVRSAYSTMDIQADGNIAFFYEEDPESYSMVYVPLSLEEITNGEYTLYQQEGDATSIDCSEPTGNRQQETVIYDLQGRLVTNPTKGIYIMNGVKMVIK